MPKYDYECKKCGKMLSVRHSISETPKIESDCVAGKCDMTKKPSLSLRILKTEQNGPNKPGQLVKKHIEEAKEEIKIQKSESRKEFES